MVKFRYRLRQRKETPFHFLSQLDMSRLWDRILRKSGVPILYSQGFNPRPLLSFGPATPLGVESEAEYLEMFLGEEIKVVDLERELNQYLPQELRVEEVVLVAPQTPPLLRSMKGIIYAFLFLDFSSFGEVLFTEGVTVQGWQKKEGSSWMLALFWGEKILWNPFKFSQWLQEHFGYPLPERVVKEEVLWS
ncbi:MAG: TIGR03936 family radical SAM-associated protein [Candidatus Caldatribacteriaceae bacterium]